MIMPEDGGLAAKWPGADWSHTSPKELLESHLNRTVHTNRAYAGDMSTLAKFLKVGSAEKAVEHMVSLHRGAARRTLDGFLAWMQTRYSLNTARRRLGCVRGLLRRAHEYGIIPWAIVNMPLPTPTPIRDTRGPGRAELERMMIHCHQRADPKGCRDEVIVRLMGVCGYRCNEVLTLDVQHVDIDAREVEIIGKGNWGTSRLRWPIDIETARVVGEWMDHRGWDNGPLLTTLQRGRTSSHDRLTYAGVYDVVADLGKRCDVGHCHPHALRHTAATEFLRLTNGNIAWAMALTRHSDPKTVMVYNDERLRRAREAMEIVAGGVPVYRYDPDTNDNL